MYHLFAGDAQVSEWADEDDEHGKVPLNPATDPFDVVARAKDKYELELGAEEVNAVEAPAVPVSARRPGGRVTPADVARAQAAQQSEQDKEDRLVGMLKNVVTTQPRPASGADEAADADAAFQATVDAAVAAEAELAEQQALLLREKGAGLGRFADQWQRRYVAVNSSC